MKNILASEISLMKVVAFKEDLSIKGMEMFSISIKNKKNIK